MTHLNPPIAIERIAHCVSAWPILFTDGTTQWEAEHVAEIATALVTVWYATNVDSLNGMGKTLGAWKVLEPIAFNNPNEPFSVWHDDIMVAQVDLEIE